MHERQVLRATRDKVGKVINLLRWDAVPLGIWFPTFQSAAVSTCRVQMSHKNGLFIHIAARAQKLTQSMSIRNGIFYIMISRRITYLSSRSLGSRVKDLTIIKTCSWDGGNKN